MTSLGGTNGLRVAVLGAGMQGVCTAIELADRGVSVELIDRADDLMTGSATANEGKIHLGYTYGVDQTLNTARRMIEGAMHFAPLVRRWIGATLDDVSLSSPYIYAVHTDSILTQEEVNAHLQRCDELIAEALSLPNTSYFGMTMRPAARLDKAALNQNFNPKFVDAGFITDELSIDPIGLAEALKARVRTDNRITLKLGRRVTRLGTSDNRPEVETEDTDGISTESYDHIVNSLWDGRLAADATLGYVPSRPWLHRFKYGLRIADPSASPDVPTVTFVQGPFGDVVRFQNGDWYKSWYPACLLGTSSELTPPDWRSQGADSGPSITEGVVNAFAELVTPLREFTADQVNDVALLGGVITAWGRSDIDDAESELHNRYEIGVHSADGHHSIDTGKYTMAPLFAYQCADRIAPDGKGM